MTIEEIKILTKDKSQAYKDGWNDAVKMCDKQATIPTALGKFLFGGSVNDIESYRAGFCEAYDEFEDFVQRIVGENQRLESIIDNWGLEKYKNEIRDLEEQLAKAKADPKQSVVDKIIEMLIAEGQIEDPDYY